MRERPWYRFLVFGWCLYAGKLIQGFTPCAMRAGLPRRPDAALAVLPQRAPRQLIRRVIKVGAVRMPPEFEQPIDREVTPPAQVPTAPSAPTLSDDLVGPVLLATLLIAALGLLAILWPPILDANGLHDGVGHGVSSSADAPPVAAWTLPADYNVRRSLLSGASAGVSRGLSRILTFPLDTIKTRQQAVLTQKSVSSDDALEQAKQVNKNQLFNGILPMLLIAAPANGAFFVAYDFVRALYVSLGWKGWWLSDLSAALLASLPANLFRIPAEVTKQRVQAGVERKALQAALTILRTEGVPGLFVGGGAHLLRELPFNAAQFVLFQGMKTQLLSSTIGQGQGAGLTVGLTALLGALAAGAAGLLTQPFDTVKTGQMIDKEHAQKDTVLWDSFRSIYSRFGWRGLYLGWTPRFWLCMIGGGFYFVAEDYVRQLLVLQQQVQ